MKENNKSRHNYKKKYKNDKSNKRDKEQKASNVNLFDKERIIFLNEEITDSLAKTIVEKLFKLDATNHKDIKLYINSPGGSVSSGLAIYDAIKYIKSDVSTIAIGRVASMASILLVAGTKGKRYAFPNSEIMIHEVSSSAFMTKVTEMKERLDHSQSLNNRLCKLIVKNTNLSMSQVKKNTVNKDTWYSAQKALRYGFVDKVLV